MATTTEPGTIRLANVHPEAGDGDLIEAGRQAAEQLATIIGDLLDGRAPEWYWQALARTAHDGPVEAALATSLTGPIPGTDPHGWTTRAIVGAAEELLAERFGSAWLLEEPRLARTLRACRAVERSAYARGRSARLSMTTGPEAWHGTDAYGRPIVRVAGGTGRHVTLYVDDAAGAAEVAAALRRVGALVIEGLAVEGEGEGA